MPTVILLDVSLKMTCLCETRKEPATKLQRSVRGIGTLLDYINLYSRLEFVAVATFSSHFEVIVPFSREYDQIKAKIKRIQLHDTPMPYLECGLYGVERLVTSEWGSGTYCHIILITQDVIHFSRTSQFSFSFPGILLSIFLSSPGIYMEKTFEHISYNCMLFTPECLDIIGIKSIFIHIAHTYYSAWSGQLVCGNFCSRVTLHPSPLPYHKTTDFGSCTHMMDNVFEICGFIELLHLGSPSSVSRHLVLPASHHLTNQSITSGRSNVTESADDLLCDDGTSPSFCVLLHGALKVENMAALCYIGNDWYGVLFSWADSKKKSNLMLSVLEPGSDSVPWLGDLNSLIITANPQTADSFPVKPVEKRSYSQNCIAWIRQTGLQSDIQKILRHARKIPDKTQQFYKELNRVRRAAICLGFISLIEGIADILERECTLLPGTAHPACAFQLTHAAGVLREPYSKDTKYNILPMKMTFS